MNEEPNRFRDIGRRFTTHAAGLGGSIDILGDEYSLHYQEVDRIAGRLVGELSVRDDTGMMVAYSYTSSLEDIGRDLEEFSLDYFADSEWRGPLENFEHDNEEL